MGRPIVSTQMTLDGVIDVGASYAAEGEHDRAGKKQLRDGERFWIHPAVWAVASGRSSARYRIALQVLGSKAFDSGVTLLRYART